MPQDTAIIKGKLDNGLTYYIRSNSYPKDRASFYFIQKTGAALEEDNENGLSHFLEHMAFNGTKHFKGNTLSSTLEKFGVKFGENLNAYTSFDETIYNISNAPTNVSGAFDTCMLVLKDWSCGIELDKKEIDKERGVIMEEWRTRQNFASRIQSQFFPVLTKGSIYAERDVIGDTSVIMTFKPKTLEKYKEKWYRPDMQAIAIVGDFNAKEVEDKVKQLFSDIPKPKKETKRNYDKIPDNAEALYTIATDPEQLSVNFILVQKHRDSIGHLLGTEEYYKQQKITEIYNQIMKERYQRRLQKSEPPFVFGSASFETLVARGSRSYTINTTLDPENIDKGIEAAVAEHFIVVQQGFYNSEVQRCKKNLIKSLDNALKNKDKRTHDSFAKLAQYNFLHTSPILDIDSITIKGKEIINSITLEDINAKIPTLKEQNQVLILTAPTHYKDSIPTKEEILTIIEDIRTDSLENIKENNVPTELINYTLPREGEIVSENVNADLDAQEWTLSNGAKVIYKFCDLNKNQMTMRAFSPGGQSVVAYEDLPSADMANVVSAFGVADYDDVILKQILAGKNVSVTPVIGGIDDEIYANCSVDDFEQMLQLTYLRFEQPRFDSVQYNSMLDRIKMQIAFKNNSPEYAMIDSIMQILTNYSKRTPLLNKAYIDRIEFEKTKRIYTERFSDASEFTFIFTGNISEEKAAPLIEKYIGALSFQNKKEERIDHNLRIAKGSTTKRVSIAMKEPKSNVMVAYQNEVQYSFENNIYGDLIGQILKMRYLKNIREEESGTYGVNLQLMTIQYPLSEIACVISFYCKPSNADSLKVFVYKEIDDLKNNGATAEELEKVVKIFKKKRAEQQQNIGFWKTALYQYYFNGVDITDDDVFNTMLESATSDAIKEKAKLFFSDADLLDLTFMPQ